MPDFSIVEIISFDIFCGKSVCGDAIRGKYFRVGTTRHLRLFTGRTHGHFERNVCPNLLDWLGYLDEIIIHRLRDRYPDGRFRPAVTVEYVDNLRQLLLMFLAIGFRA